MASISPVKKTHDESSESKVRKYSSESMFALKVTKQVPWHARVKRSWINKKAPKFNKRNGTLNAVLKTVFDFGITV